MCMCGVPLMDLGQPWIKGRHPGMSPTNGMQNMPCFVLNCIQFCLHGTDTVV